MTIATRPSTLARDGSAVASHHVDLDHNLVALACEVRAARRRNLLAEGRPAGGG